MKGLFISLNCFLIAAQFVVLHIYRNYIGGYAMKGFCSLIFVLLGIVNLVHCLVNKKDGVLFPLLITCGLIFGMTADVVLNFNFIAGAAIFAAGHLLYFSAFLVLNKMQVKDLAALLCILALSLTLVLLPIYDYGSKLMFIIVIIYALIISLMLSKALMNAVSTGKAMEIILFIGCLLFYVSDFMLLLSIFSGEKNFASTVCCYTYWPGQLIIAFSLYFYQGKTVI